MGQGALQLAIWIVCTVAQTVVLIAMLRRKLVNEFSLFFWYTAAHILDSIVSYITSQVARPAYFYVYWGWEAIDAILTLWVIQSVFLKIFDRYEMLRGLGLLIFRWATICLCLLAVFTAIYTPGNSVHGFMEGLLVMERSIQFIQVGLLLSLLLFSRIFGLGWRHYIYGIILGFGVYATIAMITAAIRVQEGTALQQITSWMLGSSYTLGALTWAYYFTSAETVEVSSKPPNSTQLQAWNEALGTLTPLLRQSKHD